MSTIAPTLKAVIFDLDGVLTDTSIYHATAWANLVKSLGHTPPVDLEERVKGISRMASLRIALGDHVADYSQEQLEKFGTQKNDWYINAITNISPKDLFPGAKKLFISLKNAGIKIVLGSASKNAKPVLESLGIAGFFDAVADGFSYTHGKPHPDVFLTGAKMVGALPEECIVVEDAAAGIDAALDGGFVAVGMGNYASLKHAHVFVPSLKKLSAETLIKHHAHYAPHKWVVTRKGTFDKKEPSLHTLFCIGNGRLGVRGTYSQLPSGHSQGIFMAGFYDKLVRLPHDPEKWSPFIKYWGYPELACDMQIEASIVKCPDFLHTSFTIDTGPVDFTQGELKKLTRSLDLRTGVFTIQAHWRSQSGKEIRMTERRFADFVATNRVFVSYEVEALNFSGALQVSAGIDAMVTNESELKPHRLFNILDHKRYGESGVVLRVKGTCDGQIAAFGTSTHVVDKPLQPFEYQGDYRSQHCSTTITLEQNELIRIERVAVVALDKNEKEPMQSVMTSLESAQKTSFSAARIEHIARFKQLWENSDVSIDGDDRDQLGLRYSIYNLLIAGSENDDTVSIPAKGLTGEGYRGMVFWDTDLHMVPFYNFTQPKMARNLAAFRANTLNGARKKAACYGFKGASYPWETGHSGAEECEKWLKLITHQVHVTAGVAYAMGQYLDCSDDTQFYRDHAAEVFIEIARYWTSKAIDKGNSVTIPDAGGPDEYHIVGDDSAYVNNLARYNLNQALRAMDYLKQEAPKKWKQVEKSTGITQTEIDRIADYAVRIKTMQKDNGLFEQCEGFFNLRDEICRDDSKGPQNTQTVKQGDVIMLLYLLPGLAPQALKTNWDYYEPRTIHGSSLSFGVHGIIAAELGLMDKADTYIQKCLGMDLYDEMGNTAHGAHMAANGFSWNSVVRGYAGARPDGDCFTINPHLPARWKGVHFKLFWRKIQFKVSITHTSIEVRHLGKVTTGLTLCVAGNKVSVKSGDVYSASYGRNV